MRHMQRIRSSDGHTAVDCPDVRENTPPARVLTNDPKISSISTVQTRPGPRLILFLAHYALENNIPLGVKAGLFQSPQCEVECRQSPLHIAATASVQPPTLDDALKRW